jgi:heme exporter protein B
LSSGWKAEILAVYRKELQTELRSKSGLVTAGLFSFVTVVTISLVLFNKNVNAPGSGLQDISAGLVWVVILFASILNLPRTFLLEEEQGTADLLRLFARPHAVYWGKVLFNILQVLGTATLVSVLFLGFTGTRVSVPWIYVVSLIGGSCSMAGAVTLCGAIVAQAANRAALAGAIAVPLLLPLVQLGVTGMRAAFGSGLVGGGQAAAVGLVAYAAIMLAIGPWIYAAIWKT